MRYRSMYGSVSILSVWFVGFIAFLELLAFVGFDRKF